MTICPMCLEPVKGNVRQDLLLMCGSCVVFLTGKRSEVVGKIDTLNVPVDVKRSIKTFYGIKGGTA